MTTIYKNMAVVLHDPSSRWKEGQEFPAKVMYSTESGQFDIRIDEVKEPKPKADKPKPVEIDVSDTTGIKATRRADGKGQLSWQISAERAQHIGYDVCERETLRIFNRLWEECLNASRSE